MQYATFYLGTHTQIVINWYLKLCNLGNILFSQSQKLIVYETFIRCIFMYI